MGCFSTQEQSLISLSTSQTRKMVPLWTLMLPLRRKGGFPQTGWPKGASHRLCRRLGHEQWWTSTQRGKEVRIWAFILHDTEAERHATNKKAQRLLSRAKPEFSAQRPRGAKKLAGKGGIWKVCAEEDQINTVKNPQILWESLCLSYVPLKNPPVNFHTRHKQRQKRA